MKRIVLTLLFPLLYWSSVYAQKNYGSEIPNYRDSTLIKVLQKNYYVKKKGSEIYTPNNVATGAYRDTVISIFSQFSVGKNILSKNANQLTAEIATKETRISYNAAAYSKKPVKGIYNVEIFAAGKDNLATVFGKGKTKGKFGLNLSGSFLIGSSLLYNCKEGDTVRKNRLLYAWTLEDGAQTITSDIQKEKVKEEIKDLEILLSSNTLGKYKTKEEVFSKLTLLQDSLKKFLPANKREEFYTRKLEAYDKKHAKWSGFSLWTLDGKIGYSREGFSHYTPVAFPVVYPDIIEDSYQFSRWNFNISGNYIRSTKYYSSKTSAGLGFANFTGFDGESPDEIIQYTDYQLENVKRSIEKKYTAYAFKPGLMDSYDGMSFNFSEQLLLGKKKLFGFGFSHSSTFFRNGVYKNKVSIDHTYSLLLALSKKGDVLNKNILAINITTPDLKRDLPKSFDSKTKERIRMRDKLTVGITFGLTLERLMGQ